MGSFLEAAADPARVGFDAGWKVEFRKAGTDGAPTDDEKLQLTRGNYFATVRVARSASFRAATFDIVIEGLRDEDHNKIVGAPYVFARLLLGWRDLGSGAGAPFSDIAAIVTNSDGSDGNYTEVIHGRIHTYERLSGEFKYTTHIAGIDRYFHTLRTTIAKKIEVRAGDPATRYAELLCHQGGVPIVKHQANGPFEPIDEVIEIRADLKLAAALHTVAVHSQGRGEDNMIPMYMGVDGLHVGQWMGTSTASTLSAKRLDIAGGLVEVRPYISPTSSEGDPSAEPANPFAPATVLRYQAITRGRADIGIGDLVEVEVEEPTPGSLAPTTASSVLGGLGDVAKGIAQAFGAQVAANYTEFRVVDVVHALNRSIGFVTTLRLERQPDGEPQATDHRDVPDGRETDEAARAAAALSAVARAERAEVQALDIALVRAQSTHIQDVDGREFRGQRIDIDEGLRRTGQANASTNAPPVEVATRLVNKPYLTPFAFGQTGLVIPHYPGMRVVDLHYRGEVSNAIVAGCLWPQGFEPASELGDYWLSLPVGFATNERDDTPADADIPQAKSVHDLIDGDGGRAVHVRGLRISIGENKMLAVGTRPSNATADELLIEHKSGAKIQIDADGNISISTSGNITFDAKKITMNIKDSVEVVK